MPVAVYAEAAKIKIHAAIESSRMGKRCIKNSIDRAVTFSQSIERDSMEAAQRIRKSMRYFMHAIEERERILLDRVEKARQLKITGLSDQMAGLRAALAGLAQTSESLRKVLDTMHCVSTVELAIAVTHGENQMHQFASMFKSLQPKEEFIMFVQPNYEMIQDIRNQGDIIITEHKGVNLLPAQQTSTTGNILTRRPIIRSTNNQPKILTAWDPVLIGSNILSTSPKSIACLPGMPLIGQSIPGSNFHVTLKPALVPSTSFGFDGQGDGQVSRPWGLCVDKEGNVIVADRRNNRVQVFFPDGSCKLVFGEKGTGNGQFDLPAGISTDPQNRIVVVDKDNHRIQIFTAAGTFVLKFGSYGKDCGQFQYPWDVAVNSKGEMLVTDSRNHRIQLFNPDGHFISRFCFDGVNHSRSLKGLTTPRGVCFTPQGDIIVSDFENHRLLLIDSALTKVEF